jgi:hypothetical protein
MNGDNTGRCRSRVECDMASATAAGTAWPLALRSSCDSEFCCPLLGGIAWRGNCELEGRPVDDSRSTDLVDEVASSSLPDLGYDRISELQQTTHPVIAQAVRRVQCEAGQRWENYAAFGNTP